MHISRRLAIVVAVLAVVISVLSLLSATGSIRLVEAIGLFAGGFGAGAGLVAALNHQPQKKSGR